MENLIYNTNRKKIHILEYGRVIQIMVEKCIEIQNKEERQKIAENIILLMAKGNFRQLGVSEYLEKLWSHLVIMSGHKLEVDMPCKVNLKEQINPPQKLNYPEKQRDDYKHYGINIKKMIDLVSKMENGKEKDLAFQNLVGNMKKKYYSWNKSNIDEKNIFLDIKILSKGNLA